MTKKKKIILSILTILITLIFVISGGGYLYNYYFKNFSGFDKKLLENYKGNKDIYSKSSFEDFFVDFVNWKWYSENYKTNFMYCYGRKSVFQWTMTHYTDEAFSFIVYCEEGYEQQKRKIVERCCICTNADWERRKRNIFICQQSQSRRICI